jgi:hypothetical protein
LSWSTGFFRSRWTATLKRLGAAASQVSGSKPGTGGRGPNCTPVALVPPGWHRLRNSVGLPAHRAAVHGSSTADSTSVRSPRPSRSCSPRR